MGKILTLFIAMPLFRGYFLLLRRIFMKTTAKIISVSLSALLMSATAATAFATETNDITVSLRIEGADSCILYSSYEIPEGSTASDLIQYADSLSDDVTVTGAED